MRAERKCFVQAGAGGVVALPLEIGDGDVGERISVVGPQLGDMLKCANALRVLLGVKHRNAEVVPSHPLLVVLWVKRRWITAEVEDAGSLGHGDDRHFVVFAHAEVHKVLVEPPIVDASGDSDWARSIHWNLELVANQLGASGGDGVVVRYDTIVPYLMKIVDLAFGIYEAVGEAMGAGIEIAIGLKRAGVHEDMARGVLGFELDPTLIHIAL